MQQCLNVKKELRNKGEELRRARMSVQRLREQLREKEMLMMGPFGMGRDVVSRKKYKRRPRFSLSKKMKGQGRVSSEESDVKAGCWLPRPC